MSSSERPVEELFSEYVQVDTPEQLKREMRKYKFQSEPEAS